MEEVSVYIFYDVQKDKVRGEVADACKDYGLARIQYSGFYGTLTRNKREEVALRLANILGSDAGAILIQPVCDKDYRARREIVVNPPCEEAAERGKAKAKE